MFDRLALGGVEVGKKVGKLWQEVQVEEIGIRFNRLRIL